MSGRVDIAAVKAANPLDALIGRTLKLGRANGRGVRSGPCQCHPQRGKAPLWVNSATQSWGCLAGAGGCGGDCFSWLAQVFGLDFRAALASLAGADVPAADPAAQAALEAERAEKAAARRARDGALAEAEREKAYALWQAGVPTPGTLVDAYFRHRGLAPPTSRALRFSPDEAYFDAQAPDGPALVHRGPCLLAAIQAADGRFFGLHRTWLDPEMASDSGKAAIFGVDGSPLPAKKMRGGKQGGAIRLHEAACEHPILLVGEGIETVETVWQAVRRHDPGTAYAAWAAGDLGNMAGGGLGPSTPHPTLANRRVPSAVPDPAQPGLMPPAGIAGAILLGDGDSDPFVTRARLDCAAARWQAAGCPTSICMAADGFDFNDLARVAA